jgi:hypothetical protein
MNTNTPSFHVVVSGEFVKPFELFVPVVSTPNALVNVVKAQATKLKYNVQQHNFFLDLTDNSDSEDYLFSFTDLLLCDNLDLLTGATKVRVKMNRSTSPTQPFLLGTVNVFSKLI